MSIFIQDIPNVPEMQIARRSRREAGHNGQRRRHLDRPTSVDGLIDGRRECEHKSSSSNTPAIALVAI